MSKKIWFIIIEMFVVQAIAILFSMIFLMPSIPELIYSIFTGFLFVWIYHSTFWQIGNRDYKMNVIANNHLKEGEAEKKLFIFKGALIALPHFLANIIFVFVCSCIPDLIPIENLVLFPLIGIVHQFDGAGFVISRLIGCVIMFLPCITGYISGAHNISIIEKIYPKIIYKNQAKK